MAENGFSGSKFSLLLSCHHGMKTFCFSFCTFLSHLSTFLISLLSLALCHTLLGLVSHTPDDSVICHYLWGPLFSMAPSLPPTVVSYPPALAAGTPCCMAEPWSHRVSELCGVFPEPPAPLSSPLPPHCSVFFLPC